MLPLRRPRARGGVGDPGDAIAHARVGGGGCSDDGGGGGGGVQPSREVWAGAVGVSESGYGGHLGEKVPPAEVGELSVAAPVLFRFVSCLGFDFAFA